MAINFPDSPTNAQTYADPGTGQTWTYELATNSWTASSLATTGGVVYKGSVNITAAPPTGAKAGEQWSVDTGGTANAGYGPGITGTITKGSMVMYTGTGWIETSHSVPDATTAAKGIDTQKWSRTGTVLSPANAGDVVNISAGTAALPGLTPVGNPNTGIYSPGADQVAISTAGSGRLFVDPNGIVSVVGTATTNINFTVNGAASSSTSRNWNFPGLLLRRTASNTTSAKQISFLLDGDTENDTTLTNYLNIWGTYSGTPTTSSTSTGLSASMNLGAPNAFIAHTNGSERLRITSAGLVGIGSTTAGATLDVKAAAATTPLIVQGPSSEFLRCDQQGRLLVGTSSALVAATGVTPAFQVQGTGANAYASIARWAANSGNPGLIFNKSRGASVGTRGVVAANDRLGEVDFGGDDGTSFIIGASIVCDVDGTPGINDMPGRIVLSTTADGASSPTERMRIKASGVVNIAATTVYADNTAAKAGGLVVGDIYRKADGTLMIAF